MKIREYEPKSDDDAIVDVWLRATIPGQSFVPESEWRSQEPLVRETFLPMAETWVVEEGGEIVAFASLLGETIGGLFTHPDHQGKGYGRALIAHSHSIHDPLRIEVFRKNERALSIYLRSGFVEESHHTDERTGFEAVILRMGSVDSPSADE